MQISSYQSLYLGSNRNIFHRLKIAFRKVSGVTGIGGFIKLLAGEQIHPQACNSSQVAGGKDMDLKGRISQPLRNVPFLSLERYFLALKINLIFLIERTVQKVFIYTIKFTMLSSLSVTVKINVIYENYWGQPLRGNCLRKTLIPSF